MVTIVNDHLKMTAGRPFNQVIRIVGAKSVWPELDQLEVRAQLRTEKDSEGSLIADLHTYMTPTFDENDLLITWVMTGKQTRDLYALNWGYFKEGYFNVIVSDTGLDDARALVVPTVTLKAVDTTTSAGGSA